MTGRFGKKSHPNTWREIPVKDVLQHCSGLTCAEIARKTSASNSVLRRMLNRLELQRKVRTEGLVQRRYYRNEEMA